MASSIVQYNKLCFVCAKPALADGRTRTENDNTLNTFVLKNILDLPLEHDVHCAPDLSQMSYCKLCLDEISNIQGALGRLERLEKQVLDMKYGLEFKLIDSWEKSKQTTGTAVVLEESHSASEIRKQVSQEICKNTMLTALGKIQTKQLGRQMRLNPSFRIMKDVTIFKPLTISGSASALVGKASNNVEATNQIHIHQPIAHIPNYPNTGTSNLPNGNPKHFESRNRKSKNVPSDSSSTSSSNYKARKSSNSSRDYEQKSKRLHESVRSSSADADSDEDIIILTPDVKVEVLGDNENFRMNPSTVHDFDRVQGLRDAVEGDVIVLTKPLGSKIAVTALQWLDIPEQWSRLENIMNEEDARKAYLRGMDTITRHNDNAIGLLTKYNAHGCIQLNELGLLHQADILARTQKADVSFVIHNLPVIAKMFAVDKACGDLFNLRQGLSPETSGGLLICFPKGSAVSFCKEILKIGGHPVWIVGVVVAGDRTARIIEKPRIIEVPVKETEGVW